MRRYVRDMATGCYPQSLIRVLFLGEERKPFADRCRSRFVALSVLGAARQYFRLTNNTVYPKKVSPLTFDNNKLQICSDLNKILHTQDDICYKHYYIVSYKSALPLLKYEFLNNITHKS